MEGFIKAIESNIDHILIRKIKDGYYISVSVFKKEEMSEINDYLKQISNDQSIFLSDYSYITSFDPEEVQEDYGQEQNQ